MMTTDEACQVLSKAVNGEEECESPFKEACIFAILRMREFFTVKKALWSLMNEFPEIEESPDST